MLRVYRNAGTTLIEVLVVMVILLVGILATIQIFPKGFQILLYSRNASVATALSRDEIERLKSHPDQLPESIVSLNVDGTIDTSRSPSDLGPAGNSLLNSGILQQAGVNRGDWLRFAGANTTRHVIGEGRRVPAPRRVGAAGNYAFYGGPLILQFNPVDTLSGTGIQAYGNDSVIKIGNPASGDTWSDTDAFLVDPEGTAALSLPSGPTARSFRVSFSAYVANGSGYVRRDFTGLTVAVAAGATPAVDQPYPLVSTTFSQILLLSANNIGGRYSGITLGAIDRNTLRVQRQFLQLASTGAAWSTDDAYEFKVLDAPLGVLLFNPLGFRTMVVRNGQSEPLMARVDYDVLDWRVLRDEFRFPSGLPAQHRLPIGSLKVGGIAGPDGRPQGGIINLEGAAAAVAVSETGLRRADHVVLQDLDTGGIYYEHKVNEPNAVLLTIDKSTGLLSMVDADQNPANGTTAHLRLPDGTVLTDVQIDNRPLRLLYMARQEYAVQVLKGPSFYTSTTARPGYAQCYVGGSGAIGGVSTRVYFPPSDAGRKVSFGELNYRRTGDTAPRQMIGQDFVIKSARAGDSVGLPYIDLTDVDGAAKMLDVSIDSRSLGYAVRDVKGASVAVRTIWNPEGFILNSDSDANIRRLDVWGRAWRRSTTETYLEQGEALR